MRASGPVSCNASGLALFTAFALALARRAGGAHSDGVNLIAPLDSVAGAAHNGGTLVRKEAGPPTPAEPSSAAAQLTPAGLEGGAAGTPSPTPDAAEAEDAPGWLWRAREAWVPLSVVAGLLVVGISAAWLLTGKDSAAQAPEGAAAGGAGSLLAEGGGSADQEADHPLLLLISLTFYKFYIGFLSATWVPFLIAMEAQKLMRDRQAVFMGAAKLIYGLSIFLNPWLGLVSDRLAKEAPLAGRSFFILTGLVLAVTAIYAASCSSEAMAPYLFLAASSQWMFGEAVIDVSTEAIVPEYVPLHQFDLASSMRSLEFLIGSIVGYITLLAMNGQGVRWLYPTYASLMSVCVLLPLVSAWRLASSRPARPSSGRGLSLASFFESYVVPMRHPGCFPRACLCLFAFGLGTGPIFFTLLMVRDMVGITEEMQLQRQFSLISIAFLASAAVSAFLAGAGGDRSEEPQEVPAEGEVAAAAPAGAAAPATGPDSGAGAPPPSSCAESRRWTLMMLSTASYGLVCLVVPAVGLAGTQEARLVGMYVIALLLGATFGNCYSRFKVCTWVLLPAGVDVGNAMGFSAMAQLVGTGVGNFMAGCLLDAFKMPGSEERYASVAFVMMAWFSAASTALTCWLLNGILIRKGVSLRQGLGMAGG